jgi:plasmid maintenance system antidote protein VapI
MLMTKRKPASVGEILTQEFIEPMGLTQGALAGAMGGTAQTRQRTMQQPQGRDGADGAYPRARVR